MATEGRRMLTAYMETLREVSETVDTAKRSFINMNADSCVVSRSFMQEKLAELRQKLPEAVSRGNEIIREEETIRENAERESSALVNQSRLQLDRATQEAEQLKKQTQAEIQTLKADAEHEAAKVKADAEKEAENAVRLAQEEAARILADANAQAASITQEAKKQLETRVLESEAVRMAAVRAEEIRSSSEQAADELRTRVFNYLDGVMGEVDRCLNSMRQEVGMEREQLEKHR